MRQRRIPEIEQETLSASFILKVAHSILVLQVCSFALFVAHKFHINFLEETEGEKVEKVEKLREIFFFLVHVHPQLSVLT